MARRSDHTRDELQEIILQKSLNLVENKGFSGLTARNIAKEIGYAPGTIYNVFGSMNDLYLAVNAHTLDQLYEVLASEACNQADKAPVHNMKEMAQLYRRFAKEHKAHWLMLFTYTLPEDSSPPDWYQEKITRLFEPLESLLASYFGPKAQREQKMAARILWSSVHGLCFLEETGKIPLISGQESPPDMTGYLIDSFVNGLQNSR